jgi:hypothetical protein
MTDGYYFIIYTREEGKSKIREGLFYKSLTLGSVMTLKKVVPLQPNGETLEQKLL